MASNESPLQRPLMGLLALWDEIALQLLLKTLDGFLIVDQGLLACLDRPIFSEFPSEVSSFFCLALSLFVFVAFCQTFIVFPLFLLDIR